MLLQLKVKNKLYNGWKNVKITKSMQSLTNNFSMNIFKGDEVDITNNDLITILKDGKPFLVGYLDDLNLGISDIKKPLSISGRSKAMDLIDCSILENKQYSKLTALQIIKDFIAPFDIKISTTLILKPLETFNTKVGETYFNAINRLCKQINILPISDNLGNIKLIKNELKESGIILKDKDFKSLNFKQKYTNRFSEIIYKKETAIVDVTDAKVTDSNIQRFRPSVNINSEDKTNKDMANWKLNNDLAKSISLYGSVIEWDLEINTIVKIETSLVNGNFLIKDITYSKSDSGTISDITFVDKGLFNVI